MKSASLSEWQGPGGWAAYNGAEAYVKAAKPDASSGYRCNQKALIDFFVANPTTSFSDYTAVDDMVSAYADAVTGATCSDFPHDAPDLQAACRMALAEGRAQCRKQAPVDGRSSRLGHETPGPLGPCVSRFPRSHLRIPPVLFLLK